MTGSLRCFLERETLHHGLDVVQFRKCDAFFNILGSPVGHAFDSVPLADEFDYNAVLDQ